MNTVSPTTIRPEIFYHGTSVNAALQIQARGFDITCSGSGAGNLLGKGIYCTTVLEKATEYAKTKLGCGVVMVLRCHLGRCKTLAANDPMMKSWQTHGYDSAWCPMGANQHMLSENCVKDPANITVLGVIAGDTAALLRMGMAVRVSDGRLVIVGDEDGGVSAGTANLKRKRDGDTDDVEFLGLLRAWKLGEVVNALIFEGITCASVLVEELTLEDIEKIPVGVVYKNRLVKLAKHLCAEELQRKTSTAQATDLLQQLQSHPQNAETQREGVATLLQMAVSCPVVSAAIIRGGVIQVLVAVLTAHQDDIELQEAAFRMLVHFTVLSAHNNHETIRLAATAIPALVLSMMACLEHEALLVKGLVVLRQCVQDDKCATWMSTQIVNCGAIQAITRAMQSQQQPYCRNVPLLQCAVHLLSKLSLAENYSTALLACSGIKVLLAVMSRQLHVASIQEEGWCLLKGLTKDCEDDEACKAEVLKGGGCSLLLEHMARPHTDPLSVVKGISMLLELGTDNWQLVAEDTFVRGGIPNLIAVMRSHHANAQVMTICILALNYLCQNDEQRTAVVAAGGMSVVLAAMGADAHGSSYRLVAVGCRFVCNMAMAVTLRAGMVGNGIIPLLVGLMKEHKRILEIQEHVTASLHNFSMHSPPYRAIICKVGGIQAVVANMLKDPLQRRLQKVSCMLLRFMACEDASQTEIVAAGGIRAVVAAMKADVHTVKTQVAGIAVLNNIAIKNSEHQKLIMEVCGVDAVLAAMKQYPEIVMLQGHGCHLLYQFVRAAPQQDGVVTAPHQEAVVSSGCIAVLLQCISRHPGVGVVQDLAVPMLVDLMRADLKFDALVKAEGGVSAFTALAAQDGLKAKYHKAASEFLARHSAAA